MADGGGLTFPIPLLVVYAPRGSLLLEISILKKTRSRKPQTPQGHLEVEESTERNLPEGPEEWTDLGLVLYTN
jgi:hypothetical protein